MDGWPIQPTKRLDVVYCVRDGIRNEELRFSLRSVVANLPHRSVWIVGGRTEWLNTRSPWLNYIQRSQRGTKHHASHTNIRAAVEHPDVSDPFVIMHDDMMILRPMSGVPVLHKGPVRGIIAKYRDQGLDGTYLAGLIETQSILEYYGVYEPLCYELHIPRVVHKAKWVEAADLAARIRRRGIQCLHSRTFYGAYWGVGGIETHDYKLVRDSDIWRAETWPFLSTDDPTMRTVKTQTYRFLVERFPERSTYERGRLWVS